MVAPYSTTPSSWLIVTLLTATLLSRCSSPGIPEIDYMSEAPPGMEAELFAPGLVSTQANEHSALAFSPDGTIVLWAVMTSQYRGRLLEMKYTDGVWSKPASPSFADTTSDDYAPSFSVDGRKLFFSSRRNADGYRTGNGNRIWLVERTSGGWGTPLPLDTIVSTGNDFSHSVASNESIYFSSVVEGATGMNIFTAKKTGGIYEEPVMLPFNINSIGYEDGPFIAPDESYLIFESTRPEGVLGSHDLYISFRNKEGQWGLPVNMGAEINSAGMERFPRVSPDGRYLFFASNRDQSAEKVGFDFYWIDAEIIDKLRTAAKGNEIIGQPEGNEILEALDKHDIDRAERLLKQWIASHPLTLNATTIYSSILRTQEDYQAAEQLLAHALPATSRNIDISVELALVKFGLGKSDEGRTLLAELEIPNDQRWSRYLYLSDELFDLGKFDLSDKYLDDAMSVGPNGVFYYNRACGYALHGEGERAFTTLGKAVDLGYNSRKNYEEDPDLKSLKTDSRWKILTAKLK